MGGHAYAIAGGKGGVGKTTATVNLAAACESAGFETVVLDADLGMTDLHRLLDIEAEPSLHDVLADRATVDEALCDGSAGFDVLPGEHDLDAYRRADPAGLGDVIATLRGEYDLVLVDTGTGLSHELLVPCGRADGVLLVTTPDETAIRDAAKTAEMVRRVDGTVLGAVVNRADRDTDGEAIADRLDADLLATIPEDEAAGDEPAVATAPGSHLAKAHRKLTSHLSDRAAVAAASEASEPAGAADDVDDPTDADGTDSATAD